MPHVHVHILPRFKTDFNGKNDDIYPALESSEQTLAEDLGSREEAAETQPAQSGSRVGRGWDVPKDEDRAPRGMDEMQREAEWLSGFFG